MSEELQGFRFRAAPRVAYGEKVRLRFDRSGGALLAVCSDLSVEGMFVATRELRPLGTIVEFEIEGRDDEIARGIGDVVWARPEAVGPGRHAGLGIQFRYVDPISRDVIVELVARRRREEEAEQTAPPLVLDPPPAAARGGGEDRDREPAPVVARSTEDIVLAGRGEAEAAVPGPVERVEVAPARVGTRRRGFPWSWTILVVLLLGAAAAAWWIWFSESDATPAPASPPVARDGDRVQQSESAPATAPAAADGAATAPVEVRSVALLEGDPESSLIGVELSRVPGGVGVRVSRLEDPPRVLVRIPQADRVPEAELDLDTDLLAGVRAAVHLAAGGSELHLVFDLAGEEVRAESRLEGQRLLLRLSHD